MNGTAYIRNLWPRPGLLHLSKLGDQCLGRFAATASHWTFEDSRGRLRVNGHGEPLDSLRRWHEEIKRHHPNAVIVGYIAYEMGYHWLDLATHPCNDEIPLEYPPMQFLFFERFETQRPSNRTPPKHTLRTYSHTQLESLVGHKRVQTITSRSQYERHVRRIKDEIAAGNIYQANYTQAFDITTSLSDEAVGQAFAAANPCPYAIELEFPSVVIRDAEGQPKQSPSLSIWSTSPERFWRKSGRMIETRPIKGTIARGADKHSDRQNLRRLLHSDKEQAELLMITDLQRNDLGRIAVAGTVKTVALRRPRATPSVWHLESTITALLEEGADWTDVMRATFPGGSITGAPKRRAVEILRGLEPIPRGVYCGAVGWVDAHGDADFAIAIRTAVRTGATIRIFGGGGIVTDSDPVSEYHESLVKIAPMLDALLDDANQFHQPEASALTPR